MHKKLEPNYSNKIIQEVIEEYSPKDVYRLVENKIFNKNYIEAYAITDQYINERISKLLVITENELDSLKERFSVTYTLELMYRLGISGSYGIEFLEKIRKFKKVRKMLVHNSLNSKKIKIESEFLDLPKKLIIETDLFYFITIIDLIKLDYKFINNFKSRKEALDEWHKFNDERLKHLLDFLLDLQFTKKDIKDKSEYERNKLIKDFSDYLAQVIGEIIPFHTEETLGVKRDAKKLAEYTINLIKRK